MRIGLRLCGLAAAAVATASVSCGAVRAAPSTLPAMTGPVAPVQTPLVQKGGGVVGNRHQERSHCPGDDLGDHVGDNFGDNFGDCLWCCG